jgi:hypothetical protein
VQLIGWRRAARAVLLGLALALAAVAAACTSSNVVEVSGGFGGGPVGEIGPPDAPAPCPDRLPSGGDFCPQTPAVCEYGSSPQLGCNAVAICQSGFRWAVELPAMCEETCPPTWEDLPEGTACSVDGALCRYVEATCGCAAGPGDPDAGDDAGDPDAGELEADAGDHEAGAPPPGSWRCVRPAPGCPARMPLENAPCVRPMTCDYGSAVFGRPLTFRCDGRSWRSYEDSFFPEGDGGW